MKKKSKSVRFLARVTTFQEIQSYDFKGKKKYEHKTTRAKDGTYTKRIHFERKGKVFSQVTRWKFLDSETERVPKLNKKGDVKFVERETSYLKFVEKYAKKQIRKGSGDVTASVQKFLGTVSSPKLRKIQGEISPAVYLKSIKVTKKSTETAVLNRLPEFEAEAEEVEMRSGSGEFKKVNRERKRKAREKKRRERERAKKAKQKKQSGRMKRGNRKAQVRNIRHRK